jgi:hypothetical protein
MIRKIAMPTLVNGLLLAGIYEGTQFLTGLLTGDEDKEFNFWDVLWGGVYRTFGSILILGDFATEAAQIERRIQRGQHYYTGTGGNIVVDTLDAGTRAYYEIRELLAGKQPRKNFEDGLRQLIKFQAAFTGLPIEAVSKPLEPFWRMQARKRRKKRQARAKRR